MKYCKKCVMPDTRPKLVFDKEGVCSACRYAEQKRDINWVEREQQLVKIFDKFRSKDGSWDCIIPVSGGKDSIYQTYIAKYVYKMHPLCVTWRPNGRTVLGEENLQALRDMGVDHLDFTPHTKAFAELRKRCFIEEGDPSIADHLAIWGLVPNLALKFKIPLVIWGENPDLEYGAPENEWVAVFNRKWIAKQPVLKGKTVQDWVGNGLSLSDLQSIIYPKEELLDELGYTPVFLSHYLGWDSQKNLEIAKRFGFKVANPSWGAYYNYADLDDMYIIIHHYIEWFKFGWSMTTRDCCNEIRKGRMTREQAIKIVRERDGRLPPKSYIIHFCKRIGITEKQFWLTLEKFRNKDIWKRDNEGKWQLKDWIGGTTIPEEWRHPYENNNTNND